MWPRLWFISLQQTSVESVKCSLTCGVRSQSSLFCGNIYEKLSQLWCGVTELTIISATLQHHQESSLQLTLHLMLHCFIIFFCQICKILTMLLSDALKGTALRLVEYCFVTRTFFYHLAPDCKLPYTDPYVNIPLTGHNWVLHPSELW